MWVVASSVIVLTFVSLSSTSRRQNSKMMRIERAPKMSDYVSISRESRQGRQIQPLACVSKAGGEKGVCMFAWNCVEAGGKHLGTCIDRFYFGSCCKLENGEGGIPIEVTDISENEISDEVLSPIKETSTATKYSTTTTTTTTVTTTTSTTTWTTTSTTTTTRTTSTTTTSTTTSSTISSSTESITSPITTTENLPIVETFSAEETTIGTENREDVESGDITEHNLEESSTLASTDTEEKNDVLEEDISSSETGSVLNDLKGVNEESASGDEEGDISEDNVTSHTDENVEVIGTESTEDNSEVTTKTTELNTLVDGEQVTDSSDDGANSTDNEENSTNSSEDGNNITNLITDGENTTEQTENTETVTNPTEDGENITNPTENGEKVTDSSHVEDENEINTTEANPIEDGEKVTNPIEVDDGEKISVAGDSGEEVSDGSADNGGVTPVSDVGDETNSAQTTTPSVEAVENEDDSVQTNPTDVDVEEINNLDGTETVTSIDNEAIIVDPTEPAKTGGESEESQTKPTESPDDSDSVLVENPGEATEEEFPSSPEDPSSDSVPTTDSWKPSTPKDPTDCKDTWVAVKIGPDGTPNAVGGLGGCQAKPGQYFNCSDTVITEDVYNCTVVEGPKPGPNPDKPSAVCKDANKIEECINQTGGATKKPSEPLKPGPESDAGTPITTPGPNSVAEKSTEKNSGDILTVKGIAESSFKEICGQRPWLNESFRAMARAPRGGRMIGGQRVDKEEFGMWGKSYDRRGKIVNGEDAKYGEWPWQVSLRQWRTATFLHKCGAALLSENWAITAAHCVESVNPDELLLRMGEFDLNDEEYEPYTFQDRKVQIVASHPKFDPKTFEYDLALLRFYEPVVFTPNIIPICIPDDDEDLVGKEAWVTGWGRLYEDGPLPSKLQKVALPIINNTQCEAMYEIAGFREHIPHIFICAGYREGGKDSCEGDSGGPMSVRKEDGRYDLAGIISWGIGCAKRNQPGVMTRIAYFKDWINTIIKF